WSSDVCSSDLDDVPTIIDRRGEQQVQAGCGNEEVQIGHLAAMPHERAQIEARVQRNADDLVGVIDADGSAPNVSGQRAEIFHSRLAAPEESMSGRVAGQIGRADDVSVVVDVDREISNTITGSAEAAERDRRAVGLP